MEQRNRQRTDFYRISCTKFSKICWKKLKIDINIFADIPRLTILHISYTFKRFYIFIYNLFITWKKRSPSYAVLIDSFISIQPWRPGLAGTRAQSCDRYGSGTLHPGQVLGGSLPLLSTAFRRSHFSRQVPPSATTREILAANCSSGTVGEKDVR